MKPPAPTVEQLLDGGDRRSLGRVARVVTRVKRNPMLLPDIVAALRSPRPVIAMRAADALEKISRRTGESLAPFRRMLVSTIERTTDPAVRWNLIQCLPRLQHSRAAMRRLARKLEIWYLTDSSVLVRLASLDACVMLANQDPALLPMAERLVRQALVEPSAALRARARRLMAGGLIDAERPGKDEV